MIEDNITCRSAPRQMLSGQLDDVLQDLGITLDATGQKLLDLAAHGEMVCEARCDTASDPKGGPFLMIIKVSIPRETMFGGSLLSKLTGDDHLVELFDPVGPAYIRILRCRRQFWQALRQRCLETLAGVGGGEQAGQP